MKVCSRSRRTREHAVRRAWLLDAAEDVFLKRGFTGASIEEIARRGEVALGTLYKAFAGKEDLFVGVMERRMERFLEHVRGLSASGTPLERLEALVHATFAYFATEAPAFRLYIAATQGFPWHIRSRLGATAAARYEQLIADVEALCRRALPAPRRRLTRAIALIVVGGLNAALTEWLSQTPPAPPAVAATTLWSALRRLFAPA